MDFPDDLPRALATRLAQPLPGRVAQSRFVPELCFGRHAGPPRQDAKNAAVLALLFRRDGQWWIPLTLRPRHLPNHGGQVCFPGGMSEAGETDEQTALREYQEELGENSDRIQVIGRLSPLYVFASNFWVKPIVGFLSDPPSFLPNPAEVEQVVMLSLEALLDPSSHGHHVINRNGIQFGTPHIACDQHQIWGATCMMLGELIAVLGDLNDALA